MFQEIWNGRNRTLVFLFIVPKGLIIIQYLGGNVKLHLLNRKSIFAIYRNFNWSSHILISMIQILFIHLTKYRLSKTHKLKQNLDMLLPLQLQLHLLSPRHLPVKRLLVLSKRMPLFPFSIGIIYIYQLMVLNILILIVFIINVNGKNLLFIKGVICFNFY